LRPGRQAWRHILQNRVPVRARGGRDLARRTLELLLDKGALGIFQLGVFQSLGKRSRQGAVEDAAVREVFLQGAVKLENEFD